MCVCKCVCVCVSACNCVCVYLLFDISCCCTLQFLVPCSICASSSSISLGCVLSSFFFCCCFCFFSASADFQFRLGCLFFCLRFFCSPQLSVLITHDNDNDNDNLTSLCCLLGQLKFPFSSSLFIYLFIGDFQHFISLVCVECLLYAFCFLRF